jgi:hypothetical protein
MGRLPRQSEAMYMYVSCHDASNSSVHTSYDTGSASVGTLRPRQPCRANSTVARRV